MVEDLQVPGSILCLPLPLAPLGIVLAPEAPFATPAVVDEGAIAGPWHIVASASISNPGYEKTYGKPSRSGVEQYSAWD